MLHCGLGGTDQAFAHCRGQDSRGVTIGAAGTSNRQVQCNENRVMSDDAYDMGELLPGYCQQPDVRLVPNLFGKSQASVLLVARQARGAIYAQLTSAEVRKLANDLRDAADDADALGRRVTRDRRLTARPIPG